MSTIFLVISIIAFSLALILMIISAVIFYKLKINKVIGDLSGRTAKKQIEEVRKRNEEENDYKIKSRVKLSKIETNGIKTRDAEISRQIKNKELSDIASSKLNKPINSEKDETELLTDNINETEILMNDETEILDNTDQTEILQ